MTTNVTAYGFGIADRRKGQRYAKSSIPSFSFERGGRLYNGMQDLGAVTHLGTFQGYDSAGQPCAYDRLRVTLHNGTVVPCYRRFSADGSFAVCQDYRYTLGAK